MEGPSLYLAKGQLRPFKKRRVIQVGGNTKIDNERFVGKEVKDIFSWGKHLSCSRGEFTNTNRRHRPGALREADRQRARFPAYLPGEFRKAGNRTGSNFGHPPAL